MKKKKLTDEEAEKLKQVKEENQAIEDSILFETEALTQKQSKKRDEQKEKEIIQLTGGGQTSVYSRKQFDKMLLKEAAHRDITFIPELYDHWFRLTGLPKSKENPHYKPDIFAFFTLKYIYGRFKIKNLIDELRQRNPFLTVEGMREFKHYQWLNEENYNKLVGFISDAEIFSRGFDRMHKFDIEYCKEYGLITDADMFYNG